MTIENLLKRATDYAKLQTMPASKERMRDYVAKYDLNDYFGENVPEDERERNRKGLENITNETMSKFSTELEGRLRKTSTKGLMGIAMANDLSAYLTNIPFSNVTAYGYALFLGKSIAEIPALHRLVKKSDDWYGAAWDATKYLMLKPARYILPVIGPAIESGAFERLVKKRVRKEIKSKFIQNYGDYHSINDRILEKLNSPIHREIYLPQKQQNSKLANANS